VDEIYHPEYSAFDKIAGVEVNLEEDKTIAASLGDTWTVSDHMILDENENFLKIHRYTKYKEAEIYTSMTTSINYKDGKIISQSTDVEELDHDPSEGQDWNWEDYE
ncbi:MAG: hypothetical protein VXW29_10070, partial [SAR324 cluster bacterium]|nr:hypothetical protein [SAR324 cluster bacterium]